jgi:hypothetical protein
MYPRIVEERRAFRFVESEQAEQPPQYLRLLNHPAVAPWSVAEGWHFEVGRLHECLQRSAAWKDQHGFPREVQAAVAAGQAATSSLPTDWKQIIVDRPEHLAALLALVSADGDKERLLGFAIRAEGWELQTNEPALVVAEDWRATFPDLAREPALELWQQAWRGWCQPRGMPPTEVEACRLERHGVQLHVTASSRLIERLRAARSDALKGDAWLLAGKSRLRMAARVVLQT